MNDLVARLRWLEARDALISRRVHALTRERAINREEMLRLRLTLGPEQAVAYEEAVARG